MPKKPSLASFSDEELQAEITRRLDGVLPLSDFYFMEEDENEYDKEEERITFLIVHKRRWHLEHCTDDGVFDSYISERLPKGFQFIQESLVEYHPRHLRKKTQPEPTVKDAINLLKASGATYLKEPWHESLLTHGLKFPGEEKHFWVTVHVDNQKIKDELNEWQAKNDKPENIEAYMDKMKTWAKPKKLHVEVNSNYDKRTNISVMPKSVWNKLPEFPRDYEDE